MSAAKLKNPARTVAILRNEIQDLQSSLRDRDSQLEKAEKVPQIMLLWVRNHYGVNISNLLKDFINQPLSQAEPPTPTGEQP